MPSLVSSSAFAATSSATITKNGVTKLGGPPALDLSKVQSDKKIEDKEILAILEQPLARNTGKKKSKSKKKKTAKKASDDDEDSDSE
ncbi:hypothetical protein NLG97_g4568 [Lecanicillium saksenae]|uniref:Uncharacterized protein n=1 Tax=Lecanicillium saksenae TaxID=468837 RepID=A0ACC1QWQ8_9HYPO|nr:hypothetical protein NLG97_g4568 [Lecanicillium saksenae]